MSDAIVSNELSSQNPQRAVAADLSSMAEFDSVSVYETLRRMAAQRLRFGAGNLTLNPTALVNEAFLKLMRCYATEGLRDRSSNRAFYAAASETMRRIVIDYYRKRNQKKRGHGFVRVPIDIASLPEKVESTNLLALNDAITQFELLHPHKAELVKLRFFAKLTMPECAQALGVSLATAERQWRFSRAWLAEQLKD